MVAIAYLAIFLINILLARKKFGKMLNIVFVFTGLWCFFGILSTFGIYGLRIPSLEVHLLAWLFIETVDIVLLLLCKKNKVKFFAINQEGNTQLGYSDKATCAPFIQIIAIVFYIPILINSIPILLTDGFTATRDAYFDSDANALETVLCRFMPPGFMYALIIYYVYRAFETKKRKYLFYSLFNAFVLMVGNGGRYALFEVLLSLIVIFLLDPKSAGKGVKAKKHNSAKKMNGVLIITVLFMFAVTLLRGQNFLKSFVVYFAGSLSFLDFIFENPEMFDLTEHLYGYLTLGCIAEPFILFLKVIGISTAKIPSYYFNINCQDFYNIGSGFSVILFNNNTSVLYYFLRDFGVPGIIIGGIFLASLIAFCYNRFLQGNKFYALCYVYMAVVLFNTMMTYQLFGCSPFFTLVAMYFCVKPTKIRFNLLGNYKLSNR